MGNSAFSSPFGQLAAGAGGFLSGLKGPDAGRNNAPLTYQNGQWVNASGQPQGASTGTPPASGFPTGVGGAFDNAMATIQNLRNGPQATPAAAAAPSSHQPSNPIQWLAHLLTGGASDKIFANQGQGQNPADAWKARIEQTQQTPPAWAILQGNHAPVPPWMQPQGQAVPQSLPQLPQMPGMPTSLIT